MSVFAKVIPFALRRRLRQVFVSKLQLRKKYHQALQGDKKRKRLEAAADSLPN